MTTRTAKVMWDYDAFPLWVDGGSVGHASSSALPIPDALRADLQVWSDKMTSLMWGPDGPDAPGWDGPNRDDLRRLNVEGMSLAAQVRAALDQSWIVTYFDELEGALVQVTETP